jgi:tetratricopeptide (TPR) repeat protein
MKLSRSSLSLFLLLMSAAGQLVIAQDKTEIIKAPDAAFEKGDYSKALPLYLSALEKGAAGVHILARIAACYARAGARDEAFGYLNKAIETGQELERLKSIAKNDDNFAGLQSDARWTALLRKYLAAWGPYLKSAGAENLRLELIKMEAEDQVFRYALINWDKARDKESPVIKGMRVLIDELSGVDAKNTARLKEIVTEHGWPGKSLAGEDGAAAAWLLVQHANADLAFQKQCLELMKPLLEKGEVNKRNYAYLTDRVLVGEKKPQIYGTQFDSKDGELTPFPIEDEADVDKRRQAMGLEPLAEYKKRLIEMYGKPAARRQ